jgi:hypothetical protein
MGFGVLAIVTGLAWTILAQTATHFRNERRVRLVLVKALMNSYLWE